MLLSCLAVIPVRLRCSMASATDSEPVDADENGKLILRS